jgi:hypothetical protein
MMIQALDLIRLTARYCLIASYFPDSMLEGGTTDDEASPDMVLRGIWLDWFDVGERRVR